ncbi:MAG: hypothetical protein QGH40_09245, partial [bacterium]|nr:hypothetical protein [bacterium]
MRTSSHELHIFSLLFLVTILTLLCRVSPAPGCTPIPLDDFSLDRLHEIFEAPMTRVKIDIELLKDRFENGALWEIDRALVSLIVDWIYMGSKYDHWIITNTEKKEEEKVSQHALTWLKGLRKTGKKVKELNWLLIDRKMETFGQTLDAIDQGFSTL